VDAESQLKKRIDRMETLAKAVILFLDDNALLLEDDDAARELYKSAKRIIET